MWHVEPKSSQSESLHLVLASRLLHIVREQTTRVHCFFFIGMIFTANLHVLWSWKARFLCFVFDVNWKKNKQTGLYCHRPSSSSGKWWDKCWEISECYLPVPFLLLHNFPHCSLISPRSSFYLYDGDSVTTTSGNGNGKNHFLYQRSCSFRLSLDLCFSRSLCPW